MRKLLIQTTILAMLSVAAFDITAAPESFVYQKLGKGMASESKMRDVYDLIPNLSGNAAKARLSILIGMLNTKGAAWVMEEEGEGYILARWDYKGHTIFHRIEYNDEAVQIKYAGGLNDYRCEKLIDNSYCYKTHGNYYKYNVSLVRQIKAALKING